MHYGLVNIPGQHVKQYVRGLSWSTLTISSKTLMEHAVYTQKVLYCLPKHGLCVEADHWDFYLLETAFLGYNTGMAGVSMGKTKVSAVSERLKSL